MCEGCWLAVFISNEANQKVFLRLNTTRIQFGTMCSYDRGKGTRFALSPRYYEGNDQWNYMLCQDVPEGTNWRHLCICGSFITGIQGEFTLETRAGETATIHFDTDHSTFGKGSTSFWVDDIHPNYEVEWTSVRTEAPLGDITVTIRESKSVIEGREKEKDRQRKRDEFMQNPNYDLTLEQVKEMGFEEYELEMMGFVEFPEA
jgi:hypothetical protein